MVASANHSHHHTTLQRYERLLEISRDLISTVDISALLEQIVLAAAELTDTQAASILLVDKRTGVLYFEASVNPQGIALESVEIPIDSSIAGWVVTNDEARLIPDVTQEPMWSPVVDEMSTFQTRNLLAVPMKANDRVIGCLEALNKDGDEGFTDEDVNTMTTLAAQAAIAIENARLFQQSDLIAEMVHELRTPLAAISATTHVLNRPELGEDKRAQMIATIQEETQRLSRMTSEFLDLARLESGRTRIVQEIVELSKLLNSAVETVRPQATERNITLELYMDPPDLPDINGDPEKLKQVMLNLLTNAIKYNNEGGRVDVSATLNGGWVAIAVADTGYGISEQNLPHVFERFYRVSDHEGVAQGSGLGLAVAKRIIEGHGGDLTVESEVGVGTTFTCALPLPA